MLRELSGSDWRSILGLAERDIPDVLILRGTRNLRRHYARFTAQISEVREIGSPNGLFEDVAIGQIAGRGVGYASIYGPAMASEITHVFGLMGTRIVVQTGVCGALADDLQAGDIVIATSAGCGDGAVACYSPGTEVARADEGLVTLTQRLAGNERTFVGPIWTTAALLAEGMNDIERWAGDGNIAVDMETATTIGVAAWTGMRTVSVLSVFDNPRAGDHLALDDQTKDELRTRGEQRLNEIVLGLIADV